jgi:hypothetical protein
VVSGTRLRSGEDLAIRAESSQKIGSITFAGAVAVAGGSTGVAFSGSGVWNENTVNVAVLAAIEGDHATLAGPTIEADTITVEADNTSEIAAFAGAASVSAAVGKTAVAVALGVALAQNRIAGSVEARILNVDGGTASGVRATSGNIVVDATDAASITVTAAAASVALGFGQTGVAVAGAGAEATNRLSTATKARVVSSDLDADAGKVTVSADATGEVKAVVLAASAAVAVGQTGVGASVGVAVVRNLIGFGQTAVSALYTTASPNPDRLDGNTTVLIAEGPRKGDVYRYVGTTVTAADNGGQNFDLQLQDYGNTDLWELVNLGEARSQVLAEVANSDVTALRRPPGRCRRSTQVPIERPDGGGLRRHRGPRQGRARHRRQRPWGCPPPPPFSTASPPTSRRGISGTGHDHRRASRRGGRPRRVLDRRLRGGGVGGDGASARPASPCRWASPSPSTRLPTRSRPPSRAARRSPPAASTPMAAASA